MKVESKVRLWLVPCHRRHTSRRVFYVGFNQLKWASRAGRGGLQLLNTGPLESWFIIGVTLPKPTTGVPSSSNRVLK